MLLRTLSSLLFFGTLLAGCDQHPGEFVEQVLAGGEGREEAMLELRLRTPEEVLPVALPVVQDPGWPLENRFDLLEVLMRLHLVHGDERTGAAILGLLEDSDPAMRKRAVESVAIISHQKQLPELLQRTHHEEHDSVLVALVDAITTVGGWHVGYNSGSQWIHGGEYLTDEQRERFTRRLIEMSTGASADTVGHAVNELLERIAIQKMQFARAHTLAAQLDSAEYYYLEALKLKPDSKYILLRYGKFLLFDREQERGLELLEQNGQALRIPHLKDPPTIDGALDDAAWGDALLVTRFYKNIPLMRLHPLSHRTEARFAYTDSNLYVSWRSFVDDTSKLVANIKERDGWTWDDDSVSLRFAMDPARPIRRHSFIFNSIGVIMDAYHDQNGNQYDWNATYEVATALRSDHWTLEAEIPFEPFKGHDVAG